MANSACLDFETRKAEVRQNVHGVWVPKRWQVFMAAAVVVEGERWFHIDDSQEPDEQKRFDRLEAFLQLHHVENIFYEATRSFDEMIAKGQFINARRAFLPDPGPWPRMIHGYNYRWHNLGPKPVKNDDIPSKDVPKLWETEPEKVLNHCLVDVHMLLDRVKNSY